MAKTVGKYDGNEAVYCQDPRPNPLLQNTAAGTEMNEP